MISCFVHRIIDRTGRDYSDTHDPTWREFRDFIAAVRSEYEFVSSRDLVNMIEIGMDLRGFAHVSMDDGFASAWRAAEICRDQGVPFTLFVTSRTLEGFLPWFVRRAAAIAMTSRPVRFKGQAYELPDFKAAQQLHEDIKQEVYGLSPRQRDQAITEILAQLGMPDPGNGSDLPEKFRFLIPDELRELVRSGVEIGCHGATHCHLLELGETRLIEEIDGARAELEQIIGRRLDFFSYPDGVYDAPARERVAGSGFAGAFSVVTKPGPVKKFTIPRMVFGRYRKRFGV